MKKSSFNYRSVCSSVLNGTYLGKAYKYTPPCLSYISSSNVCLIDNDWQWPSLVLLRNIMESFLFTCLSPPGDWWGDVLGIAPAYSVSNSTLQISWDTNHLWWLLCQQPIWSVISGEHVLGSTDTAFLKVDVKQWHSQSGLPIPLFVASSSNLSKWWYVWSDCHHPFRQSSGWWVTASCPPPLSSWQQRL